MYYCVAENILAKWSGTEWVQINKQKTLAELGGVAKSVYEAKIALLEGADTTNATAIGNLTTYVGTIPADAEATNVVAYIQEMTSGIALDADLAELAGRVTTAEGKISTIETAIAEGGSVANAIAAAQTQADKGVADAAAALAKANEKTTMAEVEAKDYATKEQAQGYADAKDTAIAAAQSKADQAYTLADGKATMDEVNAAIAGAGHAVKNDVDTALSNMETAYKKADSDLKTELQANIDKKVDKSAYEAKIAELAGADTTLQGNIDTVSAAVATEKSRAEGIEAGLRTDVDAIKADYLKAADKEELQGNIDTLTGVVETLADGIDPDKVDGVKDLIKYVEDHGPEVTGMKEDIADNAEAIAGVAGRVETLEGEMDAVEGAVATKAEKTYVDEKVEALQGKDTELSNKIAALEGKVGTSEGTVDGAIADALQAAKDYTDDEIEKLGIGDYVKKTEADAAYATVGHHHDDKYDAKGAAAAAESAAKSYADGLKTTIDAAYAAEDTKLSNRIKDLEDNKAGYATTAQVATAKAEAISEAATDAANKDAVVLSEAQKGIEAVQTALDTYKTANNAEVAKKANSADVYTKTETYTKTEVDALIESAHTWGSF